MSTVVVVQKNKSVVIAADSLSSYGSTNLPASHDADPRKIAHVDDSYFGIVGCAANARVVMGALRSLQPEERRFGSAEDIFETFRNVHPILKSKFYLITEEDGEQPYESSQLDMLIANATGIYGVLAYREVFQYQRFWATGTGWQLALGAMHARYDSVDSAVDIAAAGVSAACEFDQSSALPMHTHELTLDLPVT